MGLGLIHANVPRLWEGVVAVEAVLRALRTYSIAAFVVLRFGFISLAIGMFSADLLLNIPVTTHWSARYSSSAVFVLLTVIALAAWGTYTALGGQKLWKTQAFD